MDGSEGLCKYACDTLSHAVHLNNVKCVRGKVPCEVFCLHLSSVTKIEKVSKTCINAAQCTV